MTFQIYKVFNDFDHKVYVGQTQLPLTTRLKQHSKGAGALHLHRAILKHGFERFSIVLLDTAESKAELDAKEVDWIKRLDSVKNGYNLVYAAHGGPEKAQMRWDRMSPAERSAVNTKCNLKRWANADVNARIANGQAMKDGWERKSTSRSQVIKSYWKSMTEEQRAVRSAAMKAGWAKRLNK